MIAVWCDWDGQGKRLDERVVSSLGLFAPRNSRSYRAGSSLFCQLLDSPAKAGRNWTPHCAADGSVTLFHGYLDNRIELIAALGLSAAEPDPAAVYAAALLAWGDAVDHRCVGCYCAVTVNAAQTTVRAVRSPLCAPPLHYWYEREQIVIASVPRVLLAAGLSSRIDRQWLEANLLLDSTDEERGWYHGARRVPLGGRIVASKASVRSERYYDPSAIAVRSCGEDEALEGASHLLAEAAARGVAAARRPSVLLSGGLDSPLMAAAVLDALPEQQDLPSYTFVPSRDWDGVETAGAMGNERPLVEAFAQMHPRIRPRFFPNEGISFDHRLGDLFLAIGGAPSSLTTHYKYHALWQAARDDGCDRILCANFGNFSYSQSGDWAAAEYLRRGRWRAMVAALDTDADDGRSMPRQIAAKAIMPNLALSTRIVLRKLLKGGSHSRRLPLLAASTALHDAHRTRLAGTTDDASFADFFPRDRNEANATWTAIGDSGSEDIRQGFEQLYGLRQRDMSAYRPLVEFCLSLPTERFNSGGVTRRLARRLGEGRLPDEIRLNRRTGKHGIDWHVRIGRQRLDLIQRLERYRNDADLAAVIDFDRLITSLTNWPEQSSNDIAVWGPRFVGVGQAILNAEFVRFVDGRNAF